MPITHKICLMGFGNPRKYISSSLAAGTCVYDTARCAAPIKYDTVQCLNIMERDNKSLCKIYEKVKQKYYPEKSIYKKA